MTKRRTETPGSVSDLGGIVSAPWPLWIPTVSSSVGTITTATAQARFKRIGRTALWWVRVSITTNGTGAGAVRFTLPAGFAPAVNISMLGSGRENAATGFLLRVYGDATFGYINKFDDTYLGADGYVMDVGGMYETSSS